MLEQGAEPASQEPTKLPRTPGQVVRVEGGIEKGRRLQNLPCGHRLGELWLCRLEGRRLQGAPWKGCRSFSFQFQSIPLWSCHSKPLSKKSLPSSPGAALQPRGPHPPVLHQPDLAFQLGVVCLACLRAQGDRRGHHHGLGQGGGGGGGADLVGLHVPRGSCGDNARHIRMWQ